jgi:hypothetical protein
MALFMQRRPPWVPSESTRELSAVHDTTHIHIEEEATERCPCGRSCEGHCRIGIVIGFKCCLNAVTMDGDETQ